jgi:arginine decarboxylase
METDRSWFQIPGHKGRLDLTGPVVDGDIPVSSRQPPPPHLTEPRFSKQKQLAAEFWGADLCRFGVNGSSSGSNHAAVMAVAGPGDKVIISQNPSQISRRWNRLCRCHPDLDSPNINPETGLPEYFRQAQLSKEHWRRTPRRQGGSNRRTLLTLAP